METVAASKKSQWDNRVQRASDLAARFAYAREILAFYGEVLRLQQRIFDEIPARSAPAGASDMPLRARLDTAEAVRYLPALLSLAEQKGTAKLAEEARAVRAISLEQQQAMLRGFLAEEPLANGFFARALLQPYGERLAEQIPGTSPQSDRFVCPRCQGRPQAAVLRPEGDGGKRFLLCSFCLTEWEFRRILCAVCGEENHQKLPRYSAEELEAVRVEACDTCRFYLKSIDMTVDGLAVPLVDEAATVSLDLWAAEHGYRKVEPNLMGF